MRQVSVQHKPGYVHGVGLQDALYKFLHPNASEHEVIARRGEIKIVPAEATETPVTILITGPFDSELMIELRRVALHVIQCFIPPGRTMPDVHVHSCA
ncbi:MAG: hypothetical protein QY323_02325 [Patescibacteria group bacterium]|nr:MAG: hypothetical protein QY323_02325 [Patescibacteria group bacterium]